MEMSTTTAEEWLRDYTAHERYRHQKPGVHAIRNLFDIIADHACDDRCPGRSAQAMTVNWRLSEKAARQMGEELNLRPEYPTAPLTASEPRRTSGRGR
jgi:hypothetical protein